MRLVSELLGIKSPEGASIYDVRTEGEGGQKVSQICGQTIHKFADRGGPKIEKKS